MGRRVRRTLRRWRPRLVRDSSGKPSWTHTLAVPCAVLTFAKWLAAGVSFKHGDFSIVVPELSASDAVMMLGVWLAFLGQRDWAERKYAYNEPEPETPPAPPRG